MTDKELKKLSRMELLQLLVDQGKELESTKQELLELSKAKTVLQEQLNNRELKQSEAGNIAEASLQLNGVFEAAQAAANQYLDHIKEMAEQQETLTTAALADAKAEAQRIIKEATAEAESTIANAKEQEETTQKQCQEIVDNAQAEVKKYWDDLTGRLDTFYEEHAGLRDMLAFMNKTA